MKKGMFVNYQMAEAINMLKNYDISDDEQRKMAEKELQELKTRWLEDKIPGYPKANVGAFAGMQNITIEEVKTLSEDIMQVNTYSTENAANMQYCLMIDKDGNIQKDENGEIKFDFSKLRQIADLARVNGKRLVIDSAVVFGDRYPENMKAMEAGDIEEAIATYIKKLTQEFGDVIGRIDVLNSVFQRKEIDGRECEEFWKDKLGEDYASKVLSIARDGVEESKYPNIKLGWNEFYLTHQGMPNRQVDFLTRIESLKGKLDVVGVQDNFRANMAPEDIKIQLEAVLKAIEKSGMEMSITELGCGVGGSDIEGLGEKGTEGYQKNLDELNGRIAQILDMVIDFAKEKNITSLETRYSDKYDWNDKHGHEGIKTGISGEQLGKFLLMGLTDVKKEREELIAELMSAHGESEDLKAKIAMLDKRLEIARGIEQKSREATMGLEDK